MREYETVIITKPDLPESQFNQTGEKIKTIIERHDGRLFFARNMGRKSLAYSIRKCTKGIYTCFDYAAQGTTVSELERVLRIDDGVLRFLTVLRKEEVDVEARAAEVVARGEDVSAPPEGEVRETKAEEKVEEKKAEVKAEEKKAEVKAEEGAKQEGATEPGKEE